MKPSFALVLAFAVASASAGLLVRERQGRVGGRRVGRAAHARASCAHMPHFFRPPSAAPAASHGHTPLSLQPSKNGTNPVDALYQAATLKSLLAANNVGVATGHTFTVYTRNTGR